jgi:hypothetical protein
VKLVNINWNPSNRQLRQFGAISAILLPLISWLWDASAFVATAFFAVGILVATIGWLSPQKLKPVYVGLSAVTAPIGVVIAELALVIVYFCVMAPFALFFRASGRDALKLEFDRKAATYWRRKKRPPGVKGYYRQF